MKRVHKRGRGSIFTPKDFLDVASRASVDQALSRLVKGGKLRRLAHGLYDYPKLHPTLGPLSPALHDVAAALARETDSLVQIAGAQAANALGLSTQVPARNTYLTNGPSRRVVVGKRVVDLRHTSPKHLIAPGSPAGTVVQALRFLGSSSADDVVKVAARRLTTSDKKLIASTAFQAPAWMRPALTSIAQTTSKDIDG
jgi:hypothetical protein